MKEAKHLMSETITILMATYNGEKYVSHQLDSIIGQTYTNWQLLIRDDGSKDETMTIIEHYKKQHPDKIKLVENGGSNVGSLLNFAKLLQSAANSQYIMFCDQDDEWKQDKIEITFLKMKELESQNDIQYPTLIFTNFQYVDDNMNIIASKKDFEINRIKKFGFPQLLAQNPVYGCTTMMNRALADKVGVIPPQADFHDHWIALVAAAFGRTYYMKEKTVLYRQHESNVSGNWDNDSFTKRIQRIVVNQKNVAEAKAKYIMLLTFKKIYGDELCQQYKNILTDFLCFYNKKNPLCMIRSIRNRVRSQTLVQSFLLYITILFTRSSS